MMNRILLPLAVSAMVLGSAAAFAADETATGVVESIDTATHTMKLKDGASYMFAADLNVSAVKVGDKVSIEYTVSNGNNEIVKVEAAK